MEQHSLQHHPFSLLSAAGLDRLNASVELCYFEQGDTLLAAGDKGEQVFVIEKGMVAERDARLQGDAGRIGIYTNGDHFGATSVLNGHSRYSFVAEQQTLCYLIPAPLFLSLCADHGAFFDYFRQRLVDKSRLLEEGRQSGVSMAGFMLARVAECMRAPLLMPATASLKDAAQALQQHGVDSVLVARGDSYAIATKTDLLNALLVSGQQAEAALAPVATERLVTVASGDYLFDALVTMTRHKVARVVVMDDGLLQGVVELTDVLSHFSSRSYVLGLEIEKAASLPALARVSARLPDLVDSLMAQGIKMRFAMELLAALNGRIMSRTFSMLVPEEQQQACLMVMGSEGRSEQIMKTDQDNGLILADGQHWPDCSDHMQRFTDTLLTMGYPLCEGQVMVNNPHWVGTVSQWQQRILRWAAEPDGDALLRLTILADAHAVAGGAALLQQVREVLLQRCQQDALLMSHFARPALQYPTPLTLFGSLKKPLHGINIKKAGLFPVIHGVRSLAMQQGIAATATYARLEQLAAQGIVQQREADDLGAALGLFSELRLKQQLAARHGDGEVQDNHIVVQRLSSLERELLRDALRLVNEFKQRLSRHFHLEY